MGRVDSGKLTDFQEFYARLCCWLCGIGDLATPYTTGERTKKAENPGETLAGPQVVLVAVTVGITVNIGPIITPATESYLLMRL